MDKIKGRQIGLIRSVDPLGRVVIPMEFRKKLNITEEEPGVEMFLHENGVFMRKSETIKDN